MRRFASSAKDSSEKADLSLAVSSFDSAFSGRTKKFLVYYNKKETLGIILLFPSISFLIFCLFFKIFRYVKERIFI
ncbi:predicted protein [Enterococcus faecium Com15]|nr:predicted protein [Enterococcus faecium Com15]